MKIKKETKIILILFALMVISIIVISLPIIFNIKIEIFLYIMLGIITLSVILSYLTGRSKSKALQKLSFIFYFPLYFIHLILSFVMPTCVLLFNTIILFIASFGIPFFIMNQIDILFNFGLKKTTMLFICISFASILSVYLSK